MGEEMVSFAPVGDNVCRRCFAGRMIRPAVIRASGIVTGTRFYWLILARERQPSSTISMAWFFG
jgi:hypothetical protein